MYWYQSSFLKHFATVLILATSSILSSCGNDDEGIPPAELPAGLWTHHSLELKSVSSGSSEVIIHEGGCLSLSTLYLKPDKSFIHKDACDTIAQSSEGTWTYIATDSMLVRMVSTSGTTDTSKVTKLTNNTLQLTYSDVIFINSDTLFYTIKNTYIK